MCICLARQPLSFRFSCEFSYTQDLLFLVFTADYPSYIASDLQSFYQKEYTYKCLGMNYSDALLLLKWMRSIEVTYGHSPFALLRFPVSKCVYACAVQRLNCPVSSVVFWSYWSVTIQGTVFVRSTATVVVYNIIRRKHVHCARQENTINH